MELLALPAFADNLIWMLHDGLNAIVVDPGTAEPVSQALRTHGLQLAAILVTHHHADHVGGVAELLPALGGHVPGIVYGPAHEHVPVPVEPVVEGTRFALLGLDVQVLDVPGHTAGHVAYIVREAGRPPWLFCGDTLFSAGCGRLFEGTAEQMHASLDKLAALPSNTRVCCAHEYTLANLRFARAVEPHNAALADYERRCLEVRAAGAWTLPSTIEIECAVNPFLRVRQPEVVASARAHDALTVTDTDTQVFAVLRQWKNNF